MVGRRIVIFLNDKHSIMKNAFIFLVFFGFGLISVKGQIQSGEVVYKVKLNEEAINHAFEDGTFPANTIDFAKMQYEKEKKILPFLEYNLKFNHTQSLYNSPERMRHDLGIDLDRRSRMVGAFGDYFVDLSRDSILHYVEYLENKWLVYRKPSKLEWVLTNQTKKILGYVCQKATMQMTPDFGKGGDLVVWFTPEIPFQFGPLGYARLPGLILQADQGYYTFYADEIELNKNEIKIEEPKRGKLVNPEEFQIEKKKVENRMKLIYMQQR